MASDRCDFCHLIGNRSLALGSKTAQLASAPQVAQWIRSGLVAPGTGTGTPLLEIKIVDRVPTAGDER